MPKEKVQSYDFGEFRLDVANNQLLRNDSPVSITQRSFEILRILVENSGIIVKKDELLDALWEEDFVEEATLTQHIYMLRKVLKQNVNGRKYIETVPKKGYRFVVDVEAVAQTDFQPNSLGKKGFSQAVFREKTFPVTNPFFRQSAKRVADFSERFNEPKRNFWGKGGVFLTLAVFIILFFGYFYFNNNNPLSEQNPSEINSIVVLPFQQIGQEKDDKLGLGTADTLISKLGKFEGFRVLPTTSIIRFADRENTDLAEIGNKLGVDAVLAGTIQRDNEIVRVTVQLFNVKTRTILWTEKFDESYSDIFSLQDDISEQVSKRLSLKLKNNNFAPPYTEYTKNLEAYQSYSMGLFYWSKHTSHGFKEAIGHFNRAIEKDPKFALAYALLADSFAHTGHISDMISPEKARAKAEDLAKMALEIDPENAEAMASLALVYVSNNRQSEAYELLKRSIEINPNNANARQRFAWLFANRGELEKAITEMHSAHLLDPESTYIALSLAHLLNFARRPDEAINYIKQVFEIEPNSVEAKWRLAESLEQKGLYDEAETELEKLLQGQKEAPSVELFLSRIYTKNNRPEKAREIIDRIISEGKTEHSKNLIGYAYASLGDSEEAIKWLKESGIQNEVEASYILKFEPKLDPLRDNPEFQEMIEKLDEKRRT